MFGMHGYIKARQGEGDALAAVLLEAAEALRTDADCVLYVVSRDLEDADAIWVAEAWTDRAAHDASLQKPAAQEQIARARPLIEAFGGRAEFEPLGGKGL